MAKLTIIPSMVSLSTLLFLLLSSLHGSIPVHAVPITTCTQLPHPHPCHALMMNNVIDPLYAGDKTRLGFRELNIQGTIARVQAARLAASAVDINKFDLLTRAAWADCLALSEETIAHLQTAMASPSSEETQTWLSAAIANHQTCLDGFSDFRLPTPTPSLSALMSSNITELLSNSLAVNKAGIGMENNSKSGGNRKLLSNSKDDIFPEWLSGADRKLLHSSSTVVKPDLVVAKDGSGNYKTINEAVNVASKRSGSHNRFVIYVKAGVYAENVRITTSMTNLMFVGDGIDSTIVTGSKNVIDGSTTFNSATFATVAEGFIAKDMTFQNTAGPQKHQAVALRSGSDHSVFYRCSFEGYQDTLYVHTQRQFYRECNVYGTVDFIFGDAVVVFQKCKIFVRKPLSKQKNTVTAQGRSDPNENTGISIHNSVVAAASDFESAQGSIKTFLGRPWKMYSRTVFMKSNLGVLIAPAGWLEWSGNFALDTLYYGEYANTGGGAGTSGRVKWGGYHVITDAAQAGKFTVGTFLSGNSWIPATGVPFSSGL